MSIEHKNLEWAHPLVREWFLTKVGTPSKPQCEAWPYIAKKRSTLISAPTGSGKTLAAFLYSINTLVIKALSGTLKDNTEVLYVSPLKALSNDVQKNLIQPLCEISLLAKEKGYFFSDIRVGLRTGDTPSSERQRMLKKPPHILVTTPESLYILLTAGKSRAALKSVRTLIVDEIHALARDKRGTHLTLSLERLEDLCEQALVRIGLSATQKPIETMGRFLVGTNRPMPAIIELGYERKRELFIDVPGEPLTAVASNEMWEEIYDKLSTLAQNNNSTLIFTNTRRLAERIAHNLSERLGADQVAAHHGSLSRTIRLDVETRLKEGKLKALVATASLELGIDIGKLDLVVQIGSPRSIAVALQRIGRAGHWHGGISKGHFFATTREELLECAAIVRAIKDGTLDALIIPKNCFDILAQQLVAICSTESYSLLSLFELVTKAMPYATLSLESFKKIISMLTEGISGMRGRYGAFLFYDQVNDLISARRHSRLVALTNGGAIADTGLFSVIAEPQNILVGTLDEDFAIESLKGDIILLGTTSWRIKKVEATSGRVIVEDAHGMPPNVPFWRGEAPGRTDELSSYVSKLRQEIGERLPQNLSSENIEDDQKFINTSSWLNEQCDIPIEGSKQLAQYIFEGRAVLKAIPTKQIIIAERFFDEAGGMQLIIHAPFGARINKAWGLALRKKFCRSFNFELQASATDNGLNISLLEQHSFPLEDIFKFLHPNSIKEVLVQAVLQSPLFQTRWRAVAMRALALIKFRNGKKTPPHILRILSDDLLASVFPDAAACQDNLAGKDMRVPDHPLAHETLEDIFQDALDLEGFHSLLLEICSGEIKCIAIDTPLPSVFAHEILNANAYAFLDDAPLEERRARAVEMRRMLPSKMLEEVGNLDQEIIKLIKEQAWPDIRNANELHDQLQSLIAFPEETLARDPAILSLCQTLAEHGRAAKAQIKDSYMWLAAEKKQSFQAIYPDAIFFHDLVNIDETKIEREEAILNMLRHWMQILGPITPSELSALLTLTISDIDSALLKLEASGMILRGNFRQHDELEWCERRLLSRIHRQSVEKLRQGIKAVSQEHFARWLLKWQHVENGYQLKGKKGLLEVIKKLQGLEMPASSWENEILKPRVADYDSDMLDQLGLKGVIGWGRLSPHPALSKKSQKTVVPRSNISISFFVREDASWLNKPALKKDELKGLSAHSLEIYGFLYDRGASFFDEISRRLGRLPYEIEMGLWQLISAGLITADDFDNMRALVNKKRRTSKRQSIRYSTGRWSILRHEVSLADQNTHYEAYARLLLNRYGVVFRDLLKREKNMPPWRELLWCFRRLEDRGEIRGGRFVNGFAGEQYALPLALESLRAMRISPTPEKTCSLFANDPLKLAEIILTH